MFQIAKAVFGGIMLFAGRDLDWLFAFGLGYLIGVNVSDLLPADSPAWMPVALSLLLAVISMLPVILWQDGKYVLMGFLFGSYLISEYGDQVSTLVFGSRLSGSIWIIFLVGGVLGAMILGLTRDWGTMFATAILGAFLASDLFNVTPQIKSLIVAGLVVVGGLTQAIIMRIESQKALW